MGGDGNGAERPWKVDYDTVYHRGLRAGLKKCRGSYADRAEEARVKAECMRPEPRSIMLRIAKSYDLLAEKEKRESLAGEEMKRCSSPSPSSD